MPTADVDVGTWQRVVSASIGALVTSFLVTPLDVTKTRMQVQNSSICDGISCQICDDGSKKYTYKAKSAEEAKKAAATNNSTGVRIKLNVNNTNSSSASNRTSIPSITQTLSKSINVAKVNQNYYVFSNGLMEHRLPTARLRIEVFESACRHAPFRNSFDAFYKIARFEGFSHLYTGLGVTLWMAAPATVLYYSTYDVLRNHLLRFTEDETRHNRTRQVLSTFMPLVSGMTGRVFAQSVISPLELMRTQMMARTIDKNLSVYQGLQLNLRDGGFFGLWKGLVPTLWRDVPFSGIYWMSYEFYKDHFIKQQIEKQRYGTHSKENVSRWGLFMASFFSGAVSGCIATLITQPFDVLKTRRQASLLGIPTSKQDVNITKLMPLARSIAQNEGISGLYSGLPARITRVPISCAIMVSTYEVGKILLKTVEQD
eukprot:CAMPEP_0202693330 /NCGR_PEP_ID=MMETSP1385-20130828/7478_1 /ASSEMBLY_ACC=CAM_ASM_000861 /TAXON_ID=933848 /ORGANISM="Elphidium margaritaceum" /LENGTH=427 /DNA_ID=CAMNT_0049348995 /DNA_START=67 /DNA_END=1350 /DNA_ORIENTATION=+